MERNSFGFMFSLFILLISGEMVKTHTRNCYLESRTFKGLCVDNNNCAMICLSDGFAFGHCTKFRGQCMCGKPCGSPPAFNPLFGLTLPYGDAPPGYSPLEGMLLASEETSESSHSEGLSPGEAPEPSPGGDIFPLFKGLSGEMSPGEVPEPSVVWEIFSLSEGHSKERSPGEAPEPSPTEEKTPGEDQAPSTAEEMSAREAPESRLSEEDVVSMGIPLLPKFPIVPRLPISPPESLEEMTLPSDEPEEYPSPKKNEAASRPFFHLNNMN